MQKVKLGIIGTGLAWEKLHYPALVRLLDKFEISAICDNDINKAKAVAAPLGITEENVYCDYRVMLNKADIEAVDLMVPIYENFEAAKAVISAGKHLVAEKPFASSPEAAKKLIKLASSKGVKVLVAENFRYAKENILIKKLLDERRIGNAVYFIDNHVTEFQKEMLGPNFASTEWRQHPEFCGGVFLDSAVHRIALFRFLFGSVDTVFAAGRPAETDFCPYSCINALLTFKGNIAGHFSYFNIGKETQAPLVGFRIFGTEGEIYLEDKDCGFVNVSTKDDEHQAIPYKAEEGYYNELLNFYNALRNDEQIVSTPEKELGDIQVAFEILTSIEKQKSIISKDIY